MHKNCLVIFSSFYLLIYTPCVLEFELIYSKWLKWNGTGINKYQ